MLRQLRFIFALMPAFLLVAGCKTGASKKSSAGPSYDNLISEVDKSKTDGSPFSQVSTGPKKKNPFQLAWDKASNAFTPKPKKAPDATSMSNLPDNVPVEIHLSAGRLLENQGRTKEAIKQYQAAIELVPTDLTALISLARLHDRGGNFAEAVKVYEKALATHPKKAMVHNDLGLCYARKGDIEASLRSLGQAVQLAPDSRKYRNNIATVLVESGRVDDAYRYMTSTHPEHVARYNLAYLLKRRQDNAGAIQQCRLALQSQPNFAPAIDMMKSLGGSVPSATIAGSNPAAESYVGAQATIQGPRAQHTVTTPNSNPVQTSEQDQARIDLPYADGDEMPRLLPPVVDLK